MTEKTNDDPSDKLKKALTQSGVEVSATELSSHVSPIAEFNRATEEGSVKGVLESLRPSLHVSDVLAEAQASISALKIDRNELVDALRRRTEDTEAMQASLAAPQIELH